MAMCQKDVVDICVPRKGDGNRLMGSPIIKLEFEKDTLNPHIIIGESIQIRIKKRDQVYVKGVSNLDTIKISAEATGNFLKTAQNFCRIVGTLLPLLQGKCGKYIGKANI